MNCIGLKRCCQCGIEKPYTAEFFQPQNSRLRGTCRDCRNEIRIKQANICQNCNKAYYPKRSNRSTYCSRECAYEHRKAKPKVPKELKPIPIIKCKVCDNDFQPSRLRVLFCSDECRKELSRQKDRDREIKNHITKMVVCKECEFKFEVEYGSKRRSYCSLECSKKRMKRMEKARRRARMRGIDSEWFDPIEIFKRDDWKCQLCGIKTPYKYRGTM